MGCPSRRQGTRADKGRLTKAGEAGEKKGTDRGDRGQLNRGRGHGLTKAGSAGCPSRRQRGQGQTNPRGLSVNSKLVNHAQPSELETNDLGMVLH